MELHDALKRLSDEEWLALLLAESPCLEGHALPVLPPLELQKRANAGINAEAILRDALRFYRFVCDRCGELGVPLTPQSRVLDLGCGWGRVLRLFLQEVRAEGLCGVDVDAGLVDAAKATFPHASFTRVDRRGPTSFPDGSFDLVYAVSVFSHLPEDIHFARLREAARVLRPGGLFVATTLRPDMIRLAASWRASGRYEAEWQREIALSFPEGSEAKVAAGHFLFGPYPDPEYGMTIIPRAYVAREWPVYVEVIDYLDDPETYNQAIIVARKPHQP